jgi:hypothetical protein
MLKYGIPHRNTTCGNYLFSRKEWHDHSTLNKRSFVQMPPRARFRKLPMMENNWNRKKRK